MSDRNALPVALLEPSAYPEPTSRVELVQTHLSWVFLTDRHVYKLKRPVNLGFADFTSLERRRFFCQEEVRLNRRLSPTMYLGVVPLTRKPNGSIALGGRGETVDYAVKMVRLPADRMLDALVERGQASVEIMERIADRVAGFHAAAETGGRVDEIGGSMETIRVNTEENFQQTAPFIGQTVTMEQYEAIVAYTRQFLAQRAPLFASRVSQGRIRDCHGDLHAGNICVEDGLYIYDCIEFNERFRFGDVAAEVAFLAMDLDVRGRPGLGRAFVQRYVVQTKDDALEELLPFYQCYRAYVRGKVAGFRLADAGLAEAEREGLRRQAQAYFRAAHRYARGPDRPLRLLITVGLAGTGKTTVAEALGARLDAAVISSDALRKELAGLGPAERRYEPWGQGLYAPEATARTYDALLERAREHLEAGRSVVLDASYRKQAWREGPRLLAQELGAQFWALEVVCPRELALERLRRRVAGAPVPSDGRPEILAAQEQDFDPVRSDSLHLVVDTARPIADNVEAALQALGAGGGMSGGSQALP
ncbi:MAG: kinase [Dehalococcoidia bacterium]|nr:kinase [Dehalococcoidia bacterium]